MAKNRLQWNFATALLIACAVCEPSFAMRTTPLADSIRNWGTQLTSSLTTLGQDATGIKFGYHDVDISNVTLKELKGDTLVRKIASDLGIMLDGKMLAVQNEIVYASQRVKHFKKHSKRLYQDIMSDPHMQLDIRLVGAAEAAAANYTWNSKLQNKNVVYMNAKERSKFDSDLKYNPRFKQEINHTVSSVHIPVEIYKGDIEILNGLQWTSALDKFFYKNWQLDKNILWQYFGSQSGFMRTFPASYWDTSDAVDLYDVRRRPWYTQGSSSPKDMLILIDTSGSIHGQALQLVKVAVKSLMDTLGENDFVRIGHFAKEFHIVGCFKTFVQANYRNKKKLSKDVDSLKAKGMANYKVGFKHAFEEFEKFNESDARGKGADCNKMIMLLTDGGSENAKDVFKKHNWPHKTIRVFTYAVGQTSNPTGGISWMACANRGYFSQIPAMGAIRAKVQEYVGALARPLALDHIEHAEWTSSMSDRNLEYLKALVEVKEVLNIRDYQWLTRIDPLEYIPVLSRPAAIMDAKHLEWGNIYEDTLGLGMMATVTLPVYNRTVGSSNQTILGVMGIDVTTDEMMSYIPARLFGPSGYSFSISWNGYALFHPNLHINGYVKDPPNVDFLDIEIDTPEKEELREKMINGDNGKDRIVAFVRSPDQRHLHVDARNYYYYPIKETSFSLGISIAEDQATYLEFSGDIKKDIDISMLDDNITAMLIAPWDYYEGMTQRTNLTGTMADILEALYASKNGDDSYKWDEQMLLNLYWDVHKTFQMQQYWNDLISLTDMNRDGINLRFVGTHGGLTRVYPPEMYEQFLSLRNTWKENYYRRGLLAGPDYYLFMAPYSSVAREEGADVPNITVVCAKHLTKGNISITSAVAGAVFTHKLLLNKMEEASKQSETLHCRDIDNISCFLLDDGAFLIATNQLDLQKDVGRFFGRIDSVLMWNLMNSTFHRLIEYDYQAICQEGGDGSVSAAPVSFRIPSLNTLYEVLSFNWWTSTVSWSFINFNIYNWLFSKSTDNVMASESGGRNVSCIKKGAQYYLSTEFQQSQEDSGLIVCGGCKRMYQVVQLESTNLIFVVAEPECSECDEIDPGEFPQEPVAVDDEPDFCEMEPRYRRRPVGCYSKANEDETKCGASLTQPVCHLLLATSLIIASSIMWLTVNFPS